MSPQPRIGRGWTLARLLISSGFPATPAYHFRGMTSLGILATAGALHDKPRINRLMAEFGLSIRRFRRQVHRRAAPLVVSILIFFSVLAIFNIDYAPGVQSVHIDINLPQSRTELLSRHADWRKLAYVQYVVSSEELCKAMMLFSELHETFSLALRVLYYPSSWRLHQADDENADPQAKAVARMLKEASQEYSVALHPTDILQEEQLGQTIFNNSMRKFLAYNLTQYDRVIVLDTDSLTLQNMDELFLLPPTPIALPWVYRTELKIWQFSTKLAVIQPSFTHFKRIQKAIPSWKTKLDTDLGLANDLFDNAILKLPQRPYHLLSAEFRQPFHQHYLNKLENWIPGDIIKDAKFMAFWDEQLERPWTVAEEDLQKYAPSCMSPGPFVPAIHRYRPKEDCRNRDEWARLYNDFVSRRRIVCGDGFV